MNDGEDLMLIEAQLTPKGDACIITTTMYFNSRGEIVPVKDWQKIAEMALRQRRIISLKELEESRLALVKFDRGARRVVRKSAALL